MIELDKLQLQNVVTYEKATWNFTPGMHVIRGPNRSGKSLLFATIPNLLFQTPPMEKRKKKARTFLGKSGKVRLVWKYGKSQWDVRQSVKGQSLHLDILENGKSFKAKTQAPVISKLAKKFPLAASQFYTYTYVSGTRPSTLLNGSEADRRQFFEKLFRYDVHDKIREALAEEAQEIKSAAKTGEYIDQQYQEALAGKKSFPEFLDQQVARLSKKLSKLADKVDRASRRYTKLHAYIQVFDLKQTEHDYEALLGLHTQYQKSVAALEKEYEDTVDLEARYRSYLNVSQKYREAKAELDGMEEGGDVEEAREKYKSNRESLVKIVADIKAHRVLQPLLEEMAGLEKKYGTNLKEKALNRNIGAFTSDLRRDTGTLGKLQDLVGSKSCPTCLQTLDAKATKSLISALEAAIDKGRKNIRRCRKMLRYFEIKQEVTEAGIDGKEVPSVEKYKELKTQDKQLHQRMERAVLYRNARERVENLKNGLAKKVDKPKTDSKVIAGKLKVEKRLLESIINDLKIHKKIEQLNIRIDIMDVRSQHDTYEKFLKEYRPKLSNLNNKVQALKVQKESQSQLVARIKKLANELDIYKEKAADLELYKTLMDAYGARGLRMAHLQSQIQKFEENLNLFAPLIFAEPIIFRITANHNGFNILATRNGMESEIIYLSGSEQRCFNLLSVISLIGFVPAQYRCNTIIMDEVEANMDLMSRHLLATQFLPKLKDLFANIIIVTPLRPNEFNIPLAKEYRVKKIRGKSSIAAHKITGRLQ